MFEIGRIEIEFINENVIGSFKIYFSFQLICNVMELIWSNAMDEF